MLRSTKGVLFFKLAFLAAQGEPTNVDLAVTGGQDVYGGQEFNGCQDVNRGQDVIVGQDVFKIPVVPKKHIFWGK